MSYWGLQRHDTFVKTKMVNFSCKMKCFANIMWCSLFKFWIEIWVTNFGFNLNPVCWTAHRCRSKRSLQNPNICQPDITDSLLVVLGEDAYLVEILLVSCCIQICTFKQSNMLYLLPHDTLMSIKITLRSPDSFCCCSLVSHLAIWWLK